MKARTQPFGTISVEDGTIRIKGISNTTVIPLSRVQTVNANTITGRLEIETGAKSHRVQLWNARQAQPLRDAIEAQLSPIS